MKHTPQPSIARRAALDLLLMRGRLDRLGFLREYIFCYCGVQYFGWAVDPAQQTPSPLAMLSLPVVWIVVSALVRRGHDIGMPWWMSVLIPAVPLSAAISLLQHHQTVLGTTASIALGAAPLLFMLLVRPEPFDNRWGPRTGAGPSSLPIKDRSRSSSRASRAM